MPDKNTVKEKMAGFLRVPISRLEDEALLTHLVAESFVLVEMVIALQEELGVHLVQEDLKAVKTVGDLTQVLENRAKSR